MARRMEKLIDIANSSPVLVASASIVGIVAAVCVYRAAVSGTKKVRVNGVAPGTEARILDSVIADVSARKDEIAKALSRAIQLRTISFEYSDGKVASVVGLDPLNMSHGGCSCNSHGLRAALGDESPSSSLSDAVTAPTPAVLAASRDALLGMHKLLQDLFPRMHAAGGPVARHVVNELSLLYVWRGSTTCALGTRGVGLAGHMDVVPVPDAEEWTHPPFAGVIAPEQETGKEFVWGRGAIDDKHSVIALCSAVEALLGAGYVPSVPYVALLFGHDEELGGPDGAAALARALPGILQEMAGHASVPSPPLAFLLDEGLFLLSDFLPAHDGAVAVVCVGEKGHLNVELSCDAPAGHSSVPGPSTTIGILSKAITRLESHPFPSHLHPASSLLHALLPGLPFAHRLLMANLWLTGPIVRFGMTRTPASAAMVRTTTAVTLISGGLKSNVLPPRASAVVNHRIHPSDTVASVVARDVASVNDSRVHLRPFEQLEPAPVSRSDDAAPGWSTISCALSRVWGPSVTPAPGLMLGNTDTRHYWNTAQDIYRHCPTELSMAGTALFHGKNERVSVDNLARITAFYAACIVEGCARVVAN